MPCYGERNKCQVTMANKLSLCKTIDLPQWKWGGKAPYLSHISTAVLLLILCIMVCQNTWTV